MQTFATIVGLLVLLAVAVILVLAVLHWFREGAELRRSRAHAPVKELETRRIGHRIDQFSHWLRTSPDARDIVAILSETLIRDAGLDFYQMRREFEARQKARFEAAQKAGQPEVTINIKTSGTAQAQALSDLRKVRDTAVRVNRKVAAAGFAAVARKSKTRQRDRK